MTDESERASNSADVSAGATAPPETTAPLDALSAAKMRSDSLLASIQAAATQAESLRAGAEDGLAYQASRKADIDAAVESANARLQELEQLRDAGRAAQELTAVHQGTAQSTTDQIAEFRTAASSALEEVRAAASSAEAARKQTEDAATAAASRSENIEAGRVHAEEVRAKLDAVVVQAQESATQAEAQQQAAARVLEALNAIQATAQATQAAIEVHAAAIAVSRSQGEKHIEATQSLAATADAVEASIKASEIRLAELQTVAGERLKVIEDLLLGATNAGLAHAFDKRSKTFQGPERFWQRLFFVALAGLLVLAVVEAVAFGKVDQTPGYGELARMLLHRLPFLLPLIWLAIHAARQASLARRMEEEYAFKATISTSFEGYRRQMAELNSELSEQSPLARLCIDTLRAITRPPGHVYDKHRMDPTPGTAAAEFVAPALDAVSKLQKGGKGG